MKQPRYKALKFRLSTEYVIPFVLSIALIVVGLLLVVITNEWVAILLIIWGPSVGCLLYLGISTWKFVRRKVKIGLLYLAFALFYGGVVFYHWPLDNKW